MPHAIEKTGIRIAIDRGGTFCDFWARLPGQEAGSNDVVFKLLSVNPSEYEDAPAEGIRQILEMHSGKAIPRNELLDLTPIESIRMGTTVATNALLERKGERVALLITKGFKDLLAIGNQARPHIFDLTVKKLSTLYETVVEIDERVTIEGYSEDPDPQPIDIAADPDLFQGLAGEPVRVLKRPDLELVKKDLEALWKQGYRTLALALIHSYTYPDHELAIQKLATDMGFQIAVSSQLQPMIKIVPRAQSAAADAYLSPITTSYIESFRKRFKGGLRDEHANKLLLSQSDGGLVPFTKFTGLRGILSGPAGGVVGFAKTCYDPMEGSPVLGFDMGGTSTDVSRYNGALEHIFESTTAEVTIQSPQLDINTVAAGGGSILSWTNGLFQVGPESAGASPGPACYGKDGPLTITDANFLLGRILPDFFPYGLDADAVHSKFATLTAIINEEKHGADQLTAEEVAMGFISVANAQMARPIRTLSEGRGFETSAHNLASFGGAGGQHAVAIARSLGIRKVLIHRLSSVLSAYGIALADIIVENQLPESAVFTSTSINGLNIRLRSLRDKGLKELLDQGFSEHEIRHECYLNMRYKGSDTALMIPEPQDSTTTFADGFVERHRLEFGFTQPRDIIVEDIRVRSIGRSMQLAPASPFAQLAQLESKAIKPAEGTRLQKVYFENTGWTMCPVYNLWELQPGTRVSGPAMIIDKTQTIVVDDSSEATILPEHVYLEVTDSNRKQIGTNVVDPIALSVFGHRFMSVAEQMGQTMQKTSVSINIKERLDYSCAVFSSEGGLVANAPHIPNHLGSMSYAVAWQAKRYKKGELRPGDVIVSNHPIAGGTHLPDITVVTPVFDDDENPTEILFYVANRGHHADIGGIAAGSMPSNSTELWQEGTAIESFKMVKQGVFDEEGIIDLFCNIPASYPGCSGTRTLKDNIADLKAAAAANNHGIRLIQSLVREYTWPVVQFYMQAIQQNAEESVRTLMKQFSRRFRGHPLKAVEYLDDGTPIQLKISIDGETGSATFDFTGTGNEAWNNLNAPPAIMYSSIIYCLRSMVTSDIPLNQGCLRPITVILPQCSIINPNLKAATCAGNTETSQRLTDVVLKAFRAAAGSSGTCNNVTFGYGGKSENGTIKGFGYYETIAGGAGAGANWDGQSGVHTHITNTRQSDPETFEKRYPVILREFSIRRGSGGRGFHRGGDGCYREMEMRIPLQVGVLSERRVMPPYGLKGGENGQRGVNLWIRHHEDGEVRTISLGGKASVLMQPGDRLIVMTPGGGGYGRDPTLPDETEFDDAFIIGGESDLQNGVNKFRAGGSVAAREALVSSM